MKDLIVSVVEPVLGMAILGLLTLGIVAILSRDVADRIVQKMKGFSRGIWVVILIVAGLVGMVLMEHQ